MLVNTVVSHLAYRGICVHILELTQEKNHMRADTVVSHLANRGL